jgi:hypothetical protein
VTCLRLAAILLAGATFLAASAATAKDFEPGDLRICNAKRCLPITNRPVLKLLSAFYFTGRKPPSIASPARLGAPAFELRSPNGYVTGIVAAVKFDRFLSYGVNLDRFEQGQWYRVPDRAARELRRLTTHLKPLRLTQRAVDKSR